MIAYHWFYKGRNELDESPSSDELNLESLVSTFSLLSNHIDKQRLIEEVVVQLYTRVGIYLTCSLMILTLILNH